MYVCRRRTIPLSLTFQPTRTHKKKVWDAGLVLTQYLAARPHVIAPPKACIELGAGTGAAGIAAALLGARSVVVTDLEVRFSSFFFAVMVVG